MLSIKHIVACTAAALVTAGFGAGIGVVAPAGTAAAPAPAAAAAKKYKNCTALNKVYKNGVKKSSTTKDVVRSNGKTIKKASKAKVSTSLYTANKKMDRDKDGIACEK
jgi:hypothetical protein